MTPVVKLSSWHQHHVEPLGEHLKCLLAEMKAIAEDLGFYVVKLRDQRYRRDRLAYPLKPCPGPCLRSLLYNSKGRTLGPSTPEPPAA